jgi:hypothetical protein
MAMVRRLLLVAGCVAAFGSTFHVQGCGGGSGGNGQRITSELVSDGPNACVLQGEIVPPAGESLEPCLAQTRFELFLSDGNEIELVVHAGGSFRAPICRDGGDFWGETTQSCPPQDGPSVPCSEVQRYEATLSCFRR